MGYRIQLLAGTSVRVTDAAPLSVDWTAQALAAVEAAPVVVGDDWAARVLVTTADGADVVDLTGCLVVLSVMSERDGSVLLTRRSDVDLAGSSPTVKQIVLDSQSTDNGVDGEDGRGWLTIRTGHGSTDAALVAAALGVHPFDVRLVLADGSVRTLMRGALEVLAARGGALP